MSDTMTAEEYRDYIAGNMTKAPKYGNQVKEVDGFVFDSIAEANHYKDLRLMEAAGAITHLRLQPRYPLLVNGEKVAAYVADFEYLDVETGQLVVEDCKGFSTPVYKLKAKLMKAIHGIAVKEVR